MPIKSCALHVLHFVQRVADIVEHRLVDVKQLAVLVQDNEMLRETIYELPQLPLVLPEFIFGLLAVLNVGSRDIPADDLSDFVKEWVIADQEPAIRPVLPQNPLLIFEWNSPGQGFLTFFAKSSDVVGMEDARAKRFCLHFFHR